MSDAIENRPASSAPDKTGGQGVEKLGPCPFCGEIPRLHNVGTCIDIDCCISMSLQKCDVLSLEERGTWIGEPSYKYSESAEKKALSEAIFRWNRRSPASPPSLPAGVKEDAEWFVNGPPSNTTVFLQEYIERGIRLASHVLSTPPSLSREQEAGWISVEERKPEKLARVLVLYKGMYSGKTHQTIAEYVPHKTVKSEDYLSEECDPGDLDWYDQEQDCYWVSEGWFESSFISDQNWSLGKSEVTHWMPLPAFPPPENGGEG